MGSTIDKPIIFTTTMDYKIHKKFLELARRQGFHDRKGNFKGVEKRAYKDLRDEIVVNAIECYIEENTKLL